jgi:hypothetical protein
VGPVHGVDVNAILSSLPANAREQANAKREAVVKLLEDFARTTREVEKNHWRERYRDYHLAVEAGDYVSVSMQAEGKPIDEATALERVKAATARLDLGQLGKDYLFVATSGKGPGGEVEGTYSHTIYLSRSRYPKTFALLDEVRSLQKQARSAVLEMLGFPTER